MTKSKFKEHFARELKSCRVDFARMTQQQLAEASGITAMHISHFECGRRLPSLENYAKLVKALGTNAENMIGLEK